MELKMAAAAILNLLLVSIVVTTCFSLQLFIFLPNVITVSQLVAELLRFVEKFKVAASAILY